MVSEVFWMKIALRAPSAPPMPIAMAKTLIQFAP